MSDLLSPERTAVLVPTNELRRVYVPRPMPHQREVLLSPARHKVLVAGRRWSKTTLALIAAIAGHGPKPGTLRGVLEGAHVAWIVPAFPAVTEVWREAKAALAEVVTDKSEQEHRLAVLGGGVLLVRSGEDPDSLRGFRFDGAVEDETASQKPEVWSQALAPALSDSEGWAVFLGTPKGRENHFCKLFEDAANLPGWARWQRPSSDNPLMKPAELEARRAEIGTFAFAREYEAQFVVSGGSMFTSDHFRFFDVVGNGRVALGNESLPLDRFDTFATADLAASTKSWSDFTVVASWATDEQGRLLLLDVVRAKLNGAEIVRAMESACARWKLGTVYVERNAYSSQLIDLAREKDLPVREVLADKDKISRAEPAAAAIEEGRVFFPRSAPWLSDFVSELLGFPEDKHDDQVDALSYAVATVTGRSSRRPSPLPSWE